MIHVDPNSPLGKVLLLLATPAFAALLFFQTRDFYRNYQSSGWPLTMGVITDTKVERFHTPVGEQSSPKLVYSYQVNGQPYRNDKVAFGFFRGVFTWNYTERITTSYRRGTPVQVFYQASDAAVSCLEPGTLDGAGVFMMLVGAGGVWAGTKRWLKLLQRFNAFLTGSDLQPQRP